MSRTKSAVALLLVAAMNMQAAAQNSAAGRDMPSSTPVPGTVPPAAALASIRVSALSASDSPLVHWTVRLREVRYGRPLAMNLTDEAGTFTFRDVNPGSYIIELVGADQTIRATSALLTVEAGASVFAIVRLPTQPGVIAALFGVALAQAAALTMAVATSSNVPPVQPTTPVSPR